MTPPDGKGQPPQGSPGGAPEGAALTVNGAEYTDCVLTAQDM